MHPPSRRTPADHRLRTAVEQPLAFRGTWATGVVRRRCHGVVAGVHRTRNPRPPPGRGWRGQCDGHLGTGGMVASRSSRRRATSRHRSRGHPLPFDRCRGRRAGRRSPPTHRATWSRSGDDSTEPTIASRPHDTWPRPTRGRRRSISRRPAIILVSRESQSIRRATPSPSGGPGSRQPRRSCRPRDWLRRQEPGVACRTSSPQTRPSPRSLSPATLPAMP